jgi:hypothetical protein
MKRKWILYTSIGAGVFVVGLFVAGWVLSKRFEPLVREQSVSYLSRRFDADVSLTRFSVAMGWRDPLKVLMSKGRGAIIKARIEGLSLRPRSLPYKDPIFAIDKLEFRFDLSTLWDRPVIIEEINLETFTINVPPKEDRAAIVPGTEPAKTEAPAAPAEKKPGALLVKLITAKTAILRMLPKDPNKVPLKFDIYNLRLTDAGPGVPMKFTVYMKNAKPPGIINAEGSFGPWNSRSPSETPVDGTYSFDNADLSVFKGIAGKLNSTGKFQGTLQYLEVNGEARVPDFRLTHANNPVPLSTTFAAIVDGTNGNTFLDPVEATLGNTVFTVNGSIARWQEDKGKTIALKAKFIRGRIEDCLRLAMPGESTFLRGAIELETDIEIPPEKVPVLQKLQLNGRFRMKDALFTSPDLRKQIDDYSRRSQGKPFDEEIRNVRCNIAGTFHFGGGRFQAHTLSASLPGIQASLPGVYYFKSEKLNFRGEIKLDAKLSQMMKTSWKRWALKPVDPFFSKKGAGTYVKVKVTGTRSKPEFGRE